MFLLFDIGGTNTRLALSENGKDFSDIIVYPTLQDFHGAMKEFTRRVKKLIKQKDVSAAAGGIAGTLDNESNFLLRSPNLKLWIRQPLKERLQDILGVPVFLANDADLVGLGEAVYGAGKGYKVVAYFTVSTGVGGARIVNKRIDKGVFSFEPGWQYVYGQGLNSCNRQMYDFLEFFVSGTALAKTYNRPAAAITDETIWRRVAQVLAYGLHNSIVHWSPDAVVLGGSVMRSIKLDDIEYYLKEISSIYSNIPEIKLAELENYGGLYGALYFVKRNLKKKK